MMSIIILLLVKYNETLWNAVCVLSALIDELRKLIWWMTAFHISYQNSCSGITCEQLQFSFITDVCPNCCLTGEEKVATSENAPYFFSSQSFCIWLSLFVQEHVEISQCLVLGIYDYNKKLEKTGSIHNRSMTTSEASLKGTTIKWPDQIS